MSVCYTIKFGLLSSVKLEEIMSLYKNEEREVFYKCSDNKDAYLLFAKGSIRGVSIRQEEKNRLNVRCNVLTSDTDEELLYHFLKWIGTDCKGKIVHESGMKLSGAGLTLEDIKSQMAGNQSLDLLEAVLQKEQYLNLPVWDVSIVVYKAKFEELKRQSDYPGVLLRYLQIKAFRLFHARRAKQIETKCNTISVWDYDDVIMYQSQLVAVKNPAEEEEYIFVPWEHFISGPEIAYELIPAGKQEEPYYFVSAVSDEKEASVFEYLNHDIVKMEDL